MARIMQGLTHIAKIDSVMPPDSKGRVIIRDSDGANFSLSVEDIRKIYGQTNMHLEQQEIQKGGKAYSYSQTAHD